MALQRPLVAFFDVDGTLAGRDPVSFGPAQAGIVTDGAMGALEHYPHPVVMETITDFVEKGNLAFVCSGRPPEGIAAIRSLIPFTGSITLAGARAEIGGKELWRTSIPMADAMAALRVFTAVDAPVVVETLEGAYSYVPGHEPDVPGWGPKVCDLDELERLLAAAPPVKFVWSATEQGPLEKPLQALGEAFSVVDLGVGAYEMTAPSINKGTALKRVLGYLDHPGTTVAFGDSDNDLAMLEAADVAVVMANGTPAALALADVVAPSVDEDGVARVLEWLMADGPTVGA